MAPASRSSIGVLVLLLVSCVAPRARPLTGVPFTGPLPATALPPGHARMVFRWSYDDPIFSARGDGVARVAPPDSVRLDFFSDGGVGGGGAILIGDTLRTAGDDGRKYLPPVPLLWASLGVWRVPGVDTTARMDGDTLRFEVIGSRNRYRAAFAGPELRTAARIEGGRLREQIQRSDTLVTYRHFAGRRTLVLTSIRRMADEPHDPSIWR